MNAPVVGDPARAGGWFARHTPSTSFAVGFVSGLAGALVVLRTARLVVTEGNYLLVDDPHWARARRAMDAVWFVASEETMRVERLVARHVRFGKTPHEARDWVATTDQRNSELVAGTLARADRVIVNGVAGWDLG